ncbi:MAG: toprim domain-containing protein [Candidatus Thorarchaeota archaeon]
MEYRSAKPLRDNERTLVNILSTLDEKYRPVLIIVEGKRDVRILRDLGVTSPIIKTQTQATRNQLVGQIAKQVDGRMKVLILTDFDDEGVEIAGYLESELEIQKIPTLKGLRFRIRAVMGNWRCIEELVVLLKRKDSPEPSSK